MPKYARGRTSTCRAALSAIKVMNHAPVVLVIAVALIGCGHEPEFRLEHFKGYGVFPDTIGPGPVVLVDQFDRRRNRKDSVDNLTVQYFANPVSKNGEAVRDSVTHLVWYVFRSRIEHPRRKVVYTNQFTGERGLGLTTGGPSYLLVPAKKIEWEDSDSYDPHEDSRFESKTVSHLKCYDVVEAEPDSANVALKDQSSGADYISRGPVYFCNPCSKNGGPAPNETDHLTIYRLQSVTGRDSTRSVIAIDQFGRDRLSVTQSTWLLVPTNKELWSEEEVGQPDG